MTANTPNEKTPGEDGAPRRRRWVQVLLVASLTLNVLVLSVIAGAVVRGGHDGRDHRDYRKSPSAERTMMREGGLAPLYDAMTPEARARLADALRAEGGGVRPDKAALTADFHDFVDALRNEPFDAAALSAVLETQHDRAQTRIVASRSILVAQIAAMSPEERAAFADALQARFRDALSRAPGKGGGQPAGQ